MPRDWTDWAPPGVEPPPGCTPLLIDAFDLVGLAELVASTAQHIAELERQHRHATLVAARSNLGEIRDRTYENQQHRASGLNFLITAIILWNTRYLERAVTALRQIEDVPDHLLTHPSPLGWEHINLTGDYVWTGTEQVTENPDGFRLLRPSSEPTRLVA
jgi:hypothetical protein